MFLDRHDAGSQLASLLASRYTDADAVVYALPRGGVVIGHEIAQALGVPLDVMITRKVAHPYNSEYAIGAITENGEYLKSESDEPDIDPAWIEAERQTELIEAKRRRNVYLQGRPSLSASDKTAILADDGIATGLTMQAALRSIQKQKPARIVIAVPVAPHEAVEKLSASAEVVTLIDDSFYRGAVGAYYAAFPQVDDEEVIELLRQSRT